MSQSRAGRISADKEVPENGQLRGESGRMESDSEPWYVPLTVAILKVYALVYDIVTLPIYFLLQQPWKNCDSQVKLNLLQPDDPSVGFTRLPHARSFNPDNVGTISRMFDIIVERCGDKRAFGTRKILAVRKELQPDGKIFKRFDLADRFEWMSYRQAWMRVHNITRALLALGVRPKDRVALYAETRAEWMLTAQACFRLDLTIVTVFPTLGDEGIVHSLNETEVEYLFTSADLLEKVQNLLPQLLYVRKLVYMEGPQVASCPHLSQLDSVMPFSRFEALAETLPEDFPKWSSPTPDSIAIIMYTSGTTGVPKGVLLSHRNVVWASIILSNNVQVKPGLANLAFLPLAHVMELAIEMLVMWNEQSIAYSSALTLTDKSTGIIKGQQGDIMLARPATVALVPLVLDRIKKAFVEGAREKGALAHALLHLVVGYKTRWHKKGYQTPILDRLFFKKFRDALGGQICFIATGGAPLCQETQDFVVACLDCKFVVGYGLTECTALVTISSPDDRTTGHCGFPGEGGFVKLVDWKEGGYSTNDKPYPRGEVVVGGENVAIGYFKNPELTAKVFEEKDGIRWFHTGDIGEILPGNRLRLIDRRKDLVKLANGEYVALGKVESRLKTCPQVENVCVTAVAHNRLLALVVPNPDMLRRRFGSKLPLAELCREPGVVRHFATVLREHALLAGLSSFEIPADCRLVHDEWTPDTGLVTASLKLKRHSIETFYRDRISEMMERYNSP